MMHFAIYCKSNDWLDRIVVLFVFLVCAVAYCDHGNSYLVFLEKVSVDKAIEERVDILFGDSVYFRSPLFEDHTDQMSPFMIEEDKCNKLSIHLYSTYRIGPSSYNVGVAFHGLMSPTSWCTGDTRM